MKSMKAFVAELWKGKIAEGEPSSSGGVRADSSRGDSRCKKMVGSEYK